jgi:cytochrome oxidase assembly protein ShyY1
MHEKQAKMDVAAQALGNRAPQPLLLASDPKRAAAYDWATGSGGIADATVCVLLPDEGVQAVLVDAGWWPLDGGRELPVFGCPRGQGVAVRGLLAPPPSSGLAHGDPLAASGPQRWLAARLDLPAVLRLDPERAKDDAGVMLAPGERDLDILPNTLTPERHLGYAVQWFALAATVLVVALVLTLKSKRRNRRNDG